MVPTWVPTLDFPLAAGATRPRSRDDSGVNFTLILEARLNGSVAHTTCDVIDADSCDDAEALAIAAWREAEP